MPRNNLEDATAKALDLLPHDDPARSDPRLARDAKCLEEIRATQEAAADVWLATSPLRAAPPDVLTSLMTKVDARTPLSHRNVKFFPWLAASGWVAAAVTFLLWPREGERVSPAVDVSPLAHVPPRDRGEVAITTPNGNALPVELPELPDRRVVPTERRFREELQRLQAEVNSFVEEGVLKAPRVMGLHSPNVLQPAPEETQRRVVTALADALSSLLELEGGTSSDPARMVLQRGWMPDGFTLSEGEYVRHLNFPANAPEDYDLLVSDGGIYYDEARDMIWSPDENGRGFLGRRATAEDNLNAFHIPDENALAANNSALAVRTEPEGFVIEDPASNTAKVLIDQVPVPAEGFQQVVVWTDAEGREARIPVQTPLSGPTSIAPTAVSTPETTTIKGAASAGFQSSVTLIPSVAQTGVGRLFFSLPDSNGLTSFRLIELPSVMNGVTNVTPPKVIVSGERRSRDSKLK